MIIIMGWKKQVRAPTKLPSRSKGCLPLAHKLSSIMDRILISFIIIIIIISALNLKHDLICWNCKVMIMESRFAVSADLMREKSGVVFISSYNIIPFLLLSFSVLPPFPPPTVQMQLPVLWIARICTERCGLSSCPFDAAANLERKIRPIFALCS